LKGKINYGIIYHGDKENLILKGFCDVDYANNIKDRKSKIEYFFILGSGAIAWYSMREPSIAQSTTKFELIATNKASRKGVWLRRLLNSIGLKQKEPTRILCNNIPTICLIRNLVDHKVTKHVDVRFLYIRERMGIKKIQVRCVNTRKQVANIEFFFLCFLFRHD
jgi:hypothetical protein